MPTQYLTIAAIAVLTILAASLWIYRRKRLAGQSQSDRPDGVVMLLNQPRHLTADMLASITTSFTGRPFAILQNTEPATPENTKFDPETVDWVVGASPHFVVCAKQSAPVILLVHNLSDQYFNPAEVAASATLEMRFRKAAMEHCAWLTVDVLHPKPATQEADLLRAALVAELVGPDCLALFHPPSNRFTFFEPDETKSKLRGENPVEALFANCSQVPVVLIDEDSRMKAAEAEAQRRFLDFIAAFQSGSGSQFSVKFNLVAGDRNEHIWAEVDRIENNRLFGRLANNPVELPGYTFNSPVEISPEQVEDWHFTQDGEMIGLFTVPVLQKIIARQDREHPGA